MRTDFISRGFRVLSVVVTVTALSVVAGASATVPSTPISGLSPYPDGGDPADPLAVTECNTGPQIGKLYRNSETEPYIAVNPTNPDNMIAGWHQDRWSNGSAQGVGCAYTMDGGMTWTEVIIPFTRCAQAVSPGGGHHVRGDGDSGSGKGKRLLAFERASDPWLTFGPDGSCYYMALVSDRSSPRNGMAVAKSRNGGRTWSRPSMIALHDPVATAGMLGAMSRRLGSTGGVAPHEMMTRWYNKAFKQQRPQSPKTLRDRYATRRGDAAGYQGGRDDHSGKNDDGSGKGDGRSGKDDGSSGKGSDPPPPPPDLYVFHDKNSMTADPHDRRFVYATWTLFIGDFTDLVFTRSTDGGKTWSAFEEIATDDDVDANTFVYFRQGAQIVVLPDGTLVNGYYRILLDKNTFEFVGVDHAIIRSYDRGRTWEETETRVATYQSTGAVDIELLFTQGIVIPVRDAADLPDIAVNHDTGDLYMVWQDGSLREFGASSVVISRSTDGGTTWSPPVQVHDIQDPPGIPGQSFLPSVSVADDGTVGVQYYDFRNDVFSDGPLSTDVFLSLMTPDLQRMGEVRVTDESFDMRQMVLTGDRGYFPGDYVGLDAFGGGFVAAITVANDLGLPLDFPQDNTILQVDSHNRQDIVFAHIETAQILARGEEKGTDKDSFLPEQTSRSGRYALHAAAPNPFNPATTIGFELAEPTPVHLEIFDVSGRRIRTIVDGDRMTAGPHSVRWDGLTQTGEHAASGIYLYRIVTTGYTETRRMVLLK